jgi:hypothetical protein
MDWTAMRLLKEARRRRRTPISRSMTFSKPSSLSLVCRRVHMLSSSNCRRGSPAFLPSKDRAVLAHEGGMTRTTEELSCVVRQTQTTYFASTASI